MAEVPKHIYLVRHAQSRTNETGILEGEDTPLSELGVRQAEALAQRFSQAPVELIVSSPYIRASDTANHIGIATKAPIETFEDAKERKLPETVLGKHRDDPTVKQAMSNFQHDWMHDSKRDQGESFESILTRARRVATFLEQREESCIVVVSHGFFIEFFTAYHVLGEYLTPDLFANTILKNVKSSNTAITYFRLTDESKWTLYAWNDSAHLPTLELE